MRNSYKKDFFIFAFGFISIVSFGFVVLLGVGFYQVEFVDRANLSNGEAIAQ
jgi:hypothetical protein